MKPSLLCRSLRRHKAYKDIVGGLADRNVAHMAYPAHISV
jgi:hypothetical protein